MANYSLSADTILVERLYFIVFDADLVDLAQIDVLPKDFCIALVGERSRDGTI